MNLSYNQRGLDSFDDIYMDDDLPSNFELDPSLNSLAGGILGNNNNDSDALNLNFDDPAISLRDLLVSPSLSTNPRKHVKRDGRDKQREDDNHGAITPEEMDMSDSSDASEGDSSIEKKGSDRKGKGRKGNSMEEEVKAKNREHAKNTRLRKRQYIESVKDNIQKILEERDEVDKERKKALAKVAEEMTLRKAVIWEFLQLRALASTDREAWMKLLAKDFTLVLPITPFRSFSPDEVSS